MQRQVATALLATTIAWAAPALAQDAVTSEALFRKGVDDMAAGKYDTACPAIAESLRLDPRPGTVFALGECYAKAGKPASAVVRYDEYLTAFSRMTPEQQSKQLGREKTAKEQRDLLARDVPMLVVKLAPGAPPDTLVKRDDTVLNGPSLGLPLPVDPGEHVVSAQAPNGPVTTQRVTIGKGERKEISLEVEVVAASPEVPMRRAEPIVPTAPARDGRGDTQRIVAYVLGGVGAGGVIAGAIAGGLALAKKSSVEETCSFTTHECASQEDLDDLSAARTTGLVSTIGLVAGGALLATGAIVFFTAPSSTSKSKPAASASLGFAMGPSGGFVSIAGSLQ